MQAVRTVQKPINGQLLIQVPKEFHDIELEIIIQPISDEKNKQPTIHTERLAMVAHLKGLLPNRPYSKSDHYQQ
ncbi:MAG: hypothetical protein HUU01_08525 [Saprospiraceae bacterium]|nr:hypothetical protein [Saprospiraceae bacterium]